MEVSEEELLERPLNGQPSATLRTLSGGPPSPTPHHLVSISSPLVGRSSSPQHIAAVCPQSPTLVLSAMGHLDQMM